MSKYFKLLIPLFTFLIASFYFQKHINVNSKIDTSQVHSHLKMYWYIPDGLRADKNTFNIYEWAQNGELPNLKYLMDNGCYGYSWPVFPGHTPVNFATLMTGLGPDQHGVADGAMRSLGYPLNMVANGGFSSFAKLVSPLWVQMENSGLIVSLQSIPGSTPPELFSGNTIKGRWGAWGIDFPSIVYQDPKDRELPDDVVQNSRVFNLGSELTRFLESSKPKNWNLENPNLHINSKSIEVNLSNWDFQLYGLITDKTLYISADKKNIIETIQLGQWSNWIKAQLKYQLKNDYQKDSPKKSNIEESLSATQVNTNLKIKFVRLTENGSYRIRVLYDGLNEFSTVPQSLSDKMKSEIGPMVDFVDNYPPQLVYFPEDKSTFIEEAQFSWDWHTKAVPFLAQKLNSDIVIHSIYTPNQMLTSRWWLPYIDPQSQRYNEKSNEEREILFDEVKEMYKKNDQILGEIIKSANPSTYIVFSSDHGVIPLNKEIRLNNLFAEKGWLKYIKKSNGEIVIDWKNTKVIYLQMFSIYINPKGLDGPYKRSTTQEYYKLRNEVIELIKSLKDPETQINLASHVWTYENSTQSNLPPDRVGDLIIANNPQYNWVEDITEDKTLLKGSLKGGYKQAVWPQSIEGMLTPFVIYGPNIKKNCKLSKIIDHRDQYRTITHLLKIEPPYKTEGNVLEEIFK